MSLCNEETQAFALEYLDFCSDATSLQELHVECLNLQQLVTSIKRVKRRYVNAVKIFLR